MGLKLGYEFLFVGKDDNSFLDNYAYDLSQDHGDKSGHVFVNLEVQNNPVDAEEIGNVIFETMQKVFFEDTGATPYDRFEAALKAVNGVLAEFKAQKVSGYIGNLNVIIGAIVDDELYLTQSGDAEAYLLRKRYVSIVSEGLSEETEDKDEVFSSIASGKIEVGDFVLFASTRLLRYISKTDLAQCVNKKSVNESLAEVQDIISTEILGRVGLTGILFSNAPKGDVESIENEVDSATKTIMESDSTGTRSSKESFTGKLVGAVRGYRKRKTQVFGGGGGLSRVIDWFVGLWKALFSKGFGKDKVLGVLILVIVVLAVGIFIANGSKADKAELERLDNILVSVQDKLAEAETKASFDKDAARELLDQAYLDAKSVLDSEFYREKAGLYLLEIEETRDKLDNVQRIENPVVLADLSTKRSDVNALGFALAGDRTFVYEYNALYELVLDQIQDPLTIDDEEVVIAATGFDDRKSVVFLTRSGKLIEYKDGTVSFMDTDDGAFRKGVNIEDWSNRIYVLDPTGNQIWRYTYKGTRNKFGTAEEYVNDDTDLANAVDLAIDANVYVLQNTGDLNKFYAGGKQDFFINNAPFNLSQSPSVIYTNEKLDDVYVLDGKEARVLVFSKDAKTGNLDYKAQYLFPNVDELRDVYVDPGSQIMNVLTPTQVLQVEI